MKGKLAAAAVVAIAVPIVALWEGFEPTTYKDPVGIPTICYGYTGPDVVPGYKATPEQCEVLLTASVWEHYEGVLRCIHRPVKPHEMAAITSWTYNVGVGAACRSTLISQLNAGQPASVWCQQLDRWVFAGGKRLRGLERRRGQEKQLCLGAS